MLWQNKIQIRQRIQEIRGQTRIQTTQVRREIRQEVVGEIHQKENKKGLKSPFLLIDFLFLLNEKLLDQSIYLLVNLLDISLRHLDKSYHTLIENRRLI